VLTSAVLVVLSGTYLTLAHPQNASNIGLYLPRERSESLRVAFDCVRLRLIKKGVVAEYSTTGGLWSVSLRAAYGVALVRRAISPRRREQRVTGTRAEIPPPVQVVPLLCNKFKLEVSFPKPLFIFLVLF
jgi:hypothetical protein